MKSIKFRFWNSELETPEMEYGTSDDLPFVNRAYGKDKMLCVGKILGKAFYVGDICQIHNQNQKDSNYQYIGVIKETLFGYHYRVLNPQNMYDGVHAMNVNDVVIGNIYETPELLIDKA